MNAASHSICQSLLHDDTVHPPRPRTRNLTRVLWIHEIFNLEHVDTSHEVRQPQILVLELLITPGFTLGSFLLFDLLQLLPVSDFNPPSSGSDPLCALGQATRIFGTRLSTMTPPATTKVRGVMMLKM